MYLDKESAAWAIDAALENQERRTRRERIATTIFAAMQSNPVWVDSTNCAGLAVKMADKLIAALERPS